MGNRPGTPDCGASRDPPRAAIQGGVERRKLQPSLVSWRPLHICYIAASGRTATASSLILGNSLPISGIWTLSSWFHGGPGKGRSGVREVVREQSGCREDIGRVDRQLGLHGEQPAIRVVRDGAGEQ